MSTATEASFAKHVGEIQIAPFALNRVRQERVSQLSLEQLQRKIAKFLAERPLMAWADARTVEMKTLLLSEIDELLVELIAQAALVGGSQRLQKRLTKARISMQALILGSRQEDEDAAQLFKVFLEAHDLLFLSLGYAASSLADVNFDQVYSQVNGQGARDDTFERMRLLAAGVAEKHPVAAMEQLLVTWSSFITHQEQYLDAGWVMDRVLEKDDRNYPKEYFTFEHRYWNESGELVIGKLELDEAEQAFNHRVRMLRLIRRAIKLTGKTRELGMDPQDHQPYTGLILNHRDRTSFATLAKRLTASFGQQGRIFSFEQLVSVESEPHRIVTGLPTQEILIYSS